MFDIDCPQHGRRVLLTTQRIISIDGAGADLEVRYRCWCGHVGSWFPHRIETADSVA